MMKKKTTRKSGGSASKRKGYRFESELVDILNEHGVPSQRVLGSGSFVGAKSDVKVGVQLDDDGKIPGADEGIAKMRVECKNRADTPEMFWSELKPADGPFIAFTSEKTTNEQIWGFVNQDAVSKAVMLRRAKIPPGSLKAGDYNNCVGVFMGLEDWIKLFKKAYGY